MIVILVVYGIITAAVCIPNHTELGFWGDRFAVEKSRDSRSNYTLCQPTVTEVELYEFFPVCFAEVMAALFSDSVAP